MQLPVEVQGPIKAIVIGGYTLTEIFRCHSYLTLYIVDSQGIAEWNHEDGQWTPAVSE